MESTRSSRSLTQRKSLWSLENTITEGADNFKDLLRIIDELEWRRAEFLYIVGDSVNTRIENLHWIVACRAVVI